MRKLMGEKEEKLCKIEKRGGKNLESVSGFPNYRPTK